MRQNRPVSWRQVAVGLAVAAGLGFASAATAQQKVLKFIPQADLRILDPISTTAYITRNHGYMVYDTLFATDANFKIQPQMVDKWEISKDGLTYTFTLRDGLKFHDGEPVKSADCIASIERWAKRDALGQKLAETTESWTAVNDKTFSLKLKKPFPLRLDALGKPSSNVPFIMPERIAKTDAFKNIDDPTGSGPFKMVKAEWVPGNKVVYVKNTDYVPRKEAPSWAAGGKVAKVDRVEWIYIPDSATAAAALNAGEADWWEQLPPDLIPLLAQEQGRHGREHRPARLDRAAALQLPAAAVQQREAAPGGALRVLDQKDYVIGDRRRPEERQALLLVLHLRHAAGDRHRRRAAEGQARLRQGQGSWSRSRATRARRSSSSTPPTSRSCTRSRWSRWSSCGRSASTSSSRPATGAR